MKDYHYILKDKQIIPCPDWNEWSQWYSQADRTVAKTKYGNVEVSTVFLSLDHQHDPQGEPILFETMVFGGEFDSEQERYHTWDEAVVGHEAMCERVFGNSAILDADILE